MSGLELELRSGVQGRGTSPQVYVPLFLFLSPSVITEPSAQLQACRAGGAGGWRAAGGRAALHAVAIEAGTSL